MSDNKVVLITGASSGIGMASAIYFAKHGWNVAATMRNRKSIVLVNISTKLHLLKHYPFLRG